MKKIATTLTILTLLLTLGCKKDEVEPNVTPSEQENEWKGINDPTLLHTMIVGTWVVYETSSIGQDWENVESDSIYVNITDSTVTGYPGTQGTRTYVMADKSTIILELTDSISSYMYCSFKNNNMQINNEKGEMDVKMRK